MGSQAQPSPVPVDEPAEARAVNPLLFVFFCPHCVLSGIFALTATGLVSVPPVLGVPIEFYLAPVLLFGTFFGWLAWGQWSKRKACQQGACTSS